MRNRKVVYVGHVPVGGNHPISVQSMTNTKTTDIEATAAQISRLKEAGCDIVRVAVPDMASAAAMKAIVGQSPIPVIADIHFDYKLALAAVDAGVNGLRLNPGNLKDRDGIRQVVNKCRDAGISIRVGVNGGSVDRKKYPVLDEEAMAKSAMDHIEILEAEGFTDIKVSMKSSDIALTLASYRLFSTMRDYPLHGGLTEAGGGIPGIVRSTVGLSRLLEEELADTVRVSLTGDPVDEVICAREILKACGAGRPGVTVISCPTCGRTEVDVEKMSAELRRRTAHMKKNITIAVMGCAVNGPGEAREADFGIAGGRHEGLLFSKCEIIAKYDESELVDRLLEAMEKDGGDED